MALFLEAADVVRIGDAEIPWHLNLSLTVLLKMVRKETFCTQLEALTFYRMVSITENTDSRYKLF